MLHSPADAPSPDNTTKGITTVAAQVARTSHSTTSRQADTALRRAEAAFADADSALFALFDQFRERGQITFDDLVALEDAANEFQESTERRALCRAQVACPALTDVLRFRNNPAVAALLLIPA